MVVFLCLGHATYWQHDQGVPCLSPCDSWDWLQPPPPDHPNYPNLELDKQKKNGLMELLQRVACTTLPHNYNTAVVRGLHPLMERPSQNLLKIYGLCLNTVSVPDLN